MEVFSHLSCVDLAVVGHISKNSRTHVGAVYVSSNGHIALGLSNFNEFGDRLDLRFVGYSADHILDVFGIALELFPSCEVALQVLEEERCQRFLNVDSCISL